MAPEISARGFLSPRPPSLPSDAIKSSLVLRSSVSAARRSLSPSVSCPRRAPLSPPSPLSSVSPPSSLRSSSRLGATSIGFAEWLPTPSAAPLRPPTAGAPSPSSSRTAPPRSSAPFVVSAVLVSRGEPWTVPFASLSSPLSRAPLRRAGGRRRRPRPRVRLTRGTHGADRRQPRAPGPPWTERLTRGPHSRGPGPRALSRG
uniref:Uncharacterized protein n=1 Tax=Oryza sativa subsp. japonica TaxID=39947 RepID=Q69MP9_ORYSJ|nr:hypothetical protein [Oryza sativa Japonica Group]